MIGSGRGVDLQDDPGVAGLDELGMSQSPPAIEGMPAPAHARRSRLPIIIGLAIVLVVFSVGALVANAALSSTYSPRRAVEDYFAAQAHRDAAGMFANATFLRGDGAYGQFFGLTELQHMLQLPANSDIHSVSITAVREVDGSTRTVSVSMTWNGVRRSEQLTVRKDSSRMHWLIYPSWRVEIPSTTITVKLPNQPGSVLVDGIAATEPNQTAIQSIRGYHQVIMQASRFWDEASQDVSGIDAAVTATFPGTLSESARLDSAAAIKNAFTTNCDPTKYEDCFDHTYPAPDRNFTYYFPLPGYGNVNYVRYTPTLTADPTADMKLTVEAGLGKASASGSCTETITVDGARKYWLRGDWSATLIWSSTGVEATVQWNCARQKA